MNAMLGFLFLDRGHGRAFIDHEDFAKLEANYEAPLLQAPLGTAYRSAGVLYPSATAASQRRIQLYEIEMGQTGPLASTDCQVQWDVSRFNQTALLAGSSVVPNSLDPADVSPLSQFFNNITTELTYTLAGFGLALKNWGINQRGSYRWRALDDGDNIIVPATAVAGVGVRALSTNFNASCVGNISFVER